MLKIHSRRAALQQIVLATGSSIFLAGCSGGSGRRRGDRGGPGASDASAMGPGEGFGTQDYGALYRRAMDFKNAGDCSRAVPLLNSLAQMGPGYEGAQQALGECLLERAAGSVTEQMAALVWLRRAAEGGRAEAQGRLAYVYLSGPETLRNRAQALFWYALYLETPGRQRFGFTPLTPEEETVLSSTFVDADLASVSIDVAGWMPSAWIPPKTSQPAPDREIRSRSGRASDRIGAEFRRS